MPAPRIGSGCRVRPRYNLWHSLKHRRRLRMQVACLHRRREDLVADAPRALTSRDRPHDSAPRAAGRLRPVSIRTTRRRRGRLPAFARAAADPGGGAARLEPRPRDKRPGRRSIGRRRRSRGCRTPASGPALHPGAYAPHAGTCGGSGRIPRPRGASQTRFFPGVEQPRPGAARPWTTRRRARVFRARAAVPARTSRRTHQSRQRVSGTGS